MIELIFMLDTKDGQVTKDSFGIHAQWPANWYELSPEHIDAVYVQPTIKQLRQVAAYRAEQKVS